MVRFTPTTETVPPVAAQDDGVEHGGVGADRLDHRLGAPARRWPPAPGASPGADRASIGSAPEPLGPGQPLGHHVDGQDARRAEERGALQRHDPDRAEADDDHGRTRA